MRTGLLGIGIKLLRSAAKGYIILALVFIVLSYFGFDSFRFLFGDGVLQRVSSRIESQSPGPVDDRRAQFIATVLVLAETEDAWSSFFKAGGQQYTAPGLVLFRTAVHFFCGTATSATGPFYCPGDHTGFI